MTSVAPWPPERELLRQLLAPWRQVIARADAFFTQVMASHGDHLRCGPGCVSCCHPDLTLLLTESLALLLALDQLERGTLELLRSRGAAGGDSCPLIADGLCQVYELRPLVCRTHGLPIWLPEQAGTPLKLEEVSCCPLNFTEAEPTSAVILNGALLNAGLTVADAMARKELPRTPSRRFSIRELLLEGWAVIGE